MTAADLAILARYRLPEAPDSLTDARALIAFVQENGALPLCVTTPRAERAIAVLVASIARRKDEHAPTIAIVGRTIDHLAAQIRRNTLADAEDLAAQQAAADDQQPDNQQPDNQPTDDQQRMIAGLTEVFTAALATAYERISSPQQPQPTQPTRKTNGQQPDDPNQNNNGGPRVPRRPIAPTQPPATSFTTF